MSLSLSPAEAFGHVPAALLGLERAPDSVVEGRPCACGEMCWANPARPVAGVVAHNATLDHLAWWERMQEREQEEEAS